MRLFGAHSCRNTPTSTGLALNFHWYVTAGSPQAWPLSHPYGPRPASGSRSVLTVASLRRGGPQAPGAATTRIRAPSRRDARLHLIRSTGHGEGFGYLARLQVEGPRPLPLSQFPMHEMPPPFLNKTHPYGSVRVWVWGPQGGERSLLPHPLRWASLQSADTF